MNKKRKLTPAEEFDIMKLVLDKFLWLGTLLAGWGLYLTIDQGPQEGGWYILAGGAIMLVFAWLIIQEFEHLR